ncbi:MAG: protease inhibitor I42 family protein [Planctomycetes bacterium]|nr:protease inhibitor I42 family protein [Planctomycetota bacterium]
MNNMTPLLRVCCLTVLAALLILTATACGVDAKKSDTRSASAGLKIGEADDGKSFQIGRGGTVTLRLPGNPTTGYTWAVDEIDKKVLELVDSSYSRSSPERIGSGGWRTLTFKAIAAGTTPVRLKYWRVWEGDASVVKRFDITIQVND